MVRAILDGRKTQTRRIVQQCRQFQNWDGEQKDAYDVEEAEQPGAFHFLMAGDMGFTDPVPCPYGAPGDRLWVKETWAENDPPSGYLYRATDSVVGALKWRPSIFMSREASRITLEIVSVRVERVQDISGFECLREGMPHPDGATFGEAKDWFRDLWDSLNAGGGFGWNANPWVWAIEFKRIGKEAA